MAVNGAALATSFGINAGLCAIFLAIFSFLRTFGPTRRFYAPKRFDPEVKSKPRRLRQGLLAWVAPAFAYPEDELIDVAGLDAAVFLRLLRYGLVLFGFVTLWVCLVLMPINATAGGPGGAQPAPPPPPKGAKAAKPADAAAGPSDIDLISVANVPATAPGYHRLWAHLLTVYIVSLAAMGLLLAFSNDISRLRARFLSTRPRTAETHTVLVTDVPGIEAGTFGAVAPKPLTKAINGAVGAATTAVGAAGQKIADVMLSGSLAPAPQGDAPAGNSKGTATGGRPAALPPLADDVLDPWAAASDALAKGKGVEDLVADEMRATYGAGAVGAVNAVRDTSKSEPLYNKYEATKAQLADVVDDYVGKLRRREPSAADPAKRKKVALLPALAPAWAREKYAVGAKPVKVDALEYLPQELERLRKEVKEAAAASEGAYAPAAFVTFKDRWAATAAAAGMHSHDECAWRVQPAPGTDEIVWGNLGMRHWRRVVRTLAMWAAFVALLIFYLPVVAAVQAVVNLDNVKSVPGLGKVASIPFVTQLLQGVLPSLVLKIFLAVLPMILNAMNRFAGAPSVSQVDFGTVSKFFIFQFVALFLYSFITGSALSQLSEMLSSPGRIVTLLGVAAAQQANFFITYLLLGACAAGFGLLRPVPLVLYLIKDKLAGTEKAKYRLWAKQQHTFGAYVANHSMALLLGLAFCAVAPLIAPVALLYFTLAGAAQRYQMAYVLSRPYEASGRMWSSIFHQIMTGIYTHQALTATVLAVKRFPYAALVAPLVVCTVAFHATVAALFRRPWTLTSLREAAALDARDASKAVSPEEAAALRDIYLAPALKLDDAAHEELLHNAKAVAARLDAAAAAGAVDGLGDVKVADIELDAGSE